MVNAKTLVQNPYYQVESQCLTPYNRFAVWMRWCKMRSNTVQKSLTARESDI
ncbi:hypothetical protein SAMN05421760_10166 [Neptunomonas antarctica]|uniref:Uncharacterized protein n=1 Tax=Neptunomonas antarctica TaxID=619304 RepID=A0A1N7ISL0_9GAMM|nr:hypothetical protein SAMN05421760_10166 [Neptunomonas antarctica]